MDISAQMVGDMIFCSAMEVFTKSGNWPAVVMTVYKRFEPNVEHFAEWRDDQLHAVHRYGESFIEWRMERAVCSTETIRGCVCVALEQLQEIENQPTKPANPRKPPWTNTSST